MKENLIFTSILLFFSILGFSQETSIEDNLNNTIQESISSSGGVLNGEQGSVSYTIGQTFHSYEEKTNYSVQSGIQRAEIDIEEITNNDRNRNNFRVNSLVYPNPTNSTITVETEGDAIGTYQLLTQNGTIIESGRIDRNSIEINMSNLSSAAYILELVTSTGFLERFKVLKK